MVQEGCLAGAEEAGDDGGGDAGIQRLCVEGRVGEAPQEPGRRRRRERTEVSGEGIEGAAGYSGGGGGDRGPGRPRKQQPRNRGHHVDRLGFDLSFAGVDLGGFRVCVRVFWLLC